MKKVLLIVAMLLMVSPVMATVTVTAVQDGNAFMGVDGNATDQAVTVSVVYSGTASDPNIRAFALDISVDSGCTIERIRDFNVGENNSAVQGYGIFPGSFAQYVSPTSPNWNWGVSGYNPLAVSGEPGASGTGLNTNTIIVEMGYLGAGESNMPGKTGTLFMVDVNAYQFTGTAHLTISADTTRGGVVSADSNATLTSGTNLPVTVPIVIAQPGAIPANEIGQPKATAIAAWTAQGFSSGNIVGTAGTVSCPSNVVQTQTSTLTPYSGTINYTYSIAPTEPNVVGMTRANAVTALTSAGFTIASPDVNSYGTTGLQQVGTVYAQSPVSGTQACNQTVVLSVVSYPIKATSSMYANWVTNGKPACWAYPRNCHGDADGKKVGSFWVQANDLTILKGALNKNPLPAGGICASFTHAKVGSFWVQANALAILKQYLNNSSIPICGDTSTTSDANFWYWCNPSGGSCPTSPANQVCATAGTCPNSP